MNDTNNISFPWSKGSGTYSTDFNRGMIGKLQFPNDLGTDKRPNYTVIYINETKGTKLSSNGGDIFSKEDPVSSESNASTSIKNGTTSVNTSSTGSSISSGIDTLASSLGTLTSQSFKRLNAVIALPMPDALTSAYVMNWNSEGIENVTQKAVSGMVSAASETAKQAGQKVRTISNINTEAAFTGVSLRQPLLGWSLFPRNETEAKAIWDIIQTLKYFAMPEATGASLLGQSGSVLQSPALFDFEFHHAKDGVGSRNDWLPRSLSCGISNISVDYITTSNGFQGFDPENFHEMAAKIKGSPSVGIALSVGFQEIEAFNRNRIDPQLDFNFRLNTNGGIF